ncbi:alpha-2-macroglobulin family protein [Kordia periserrulae]|nr:MG2 domain-containing protein [Kordia periserrulae]
MKNVLAIFMIVLFSQFANAQEKYVQLWKEVTNLEKKGLTKSAFKKASEIYALAKKEQNNPQIVKAFLHKSNYQLTLEEDAELTIINSLKAEIASQSFPTKNILQSILGQLYWQYFKSNRYKFYNRTKTKEKVDTNDFRTWDLQTIFTEIGMHLDASLKNANQLQKVDLSEFDAILIMQEGSKKFRPTVYDFLAHNALEFYKSTEITITKPEETFKIDNEEYLCDAELFAELNITTKDSLSREFKALQLYQDLIRFHLKDKSPEALINVNIERLQYIVAKANFDNAKEKLIEIFQNEKTTYNTHPYSGMYDAETAQLYKELGDLYSTENPEKHQWKYQKAVTLCDEVITKFPESAAAKRCQNLKRIILKKDFSITTESVIPIGNYSRMSINYKNVEKLFFTVRRITHEQLKNYSKLYRKEEQQAFINKLPVSKNWNATLPTENDYHFHRTEIAVPPLQNGFYMLTASHTEELHKTFFATDIIQVTDIVITHKKTISEYIFQLTNRNNGKPIENQAIEFSYQKKYRGARETQTQTTDATGSAVLEADYNDRFYDLNIKVTTANDIAYFDDFSYTKRFISDKIEPQETLFLFTDRSIYRPSQTAHFKGILVRKEGTKSTILPNEKVTVLLRDANYQVVSEQSLVTNEYGSFKSEFIIPNNGLTGNFSIHASKGKDNLGSTYFSVEEYKRPKFEAKFLPITKTFAVNDTVAVNGNAMAFAGSSISDAKVTYSVKRTPRYPQWIYWRYPYINSSSQQITSGETITDANGNFEITFKAIPDASTSKKLLPIFDYAITADITDINGETRSASTDVRVGYHSLQANVVIDKKLDASKRDYTVKIITKNLNGEKVSAKGTVTIHKLQAPNRVLRERPYKVPDYLSISEKEFKKLFPHEAYSEDEQDFKSWKKGKKVFDENFDTSEKAQLELGKLKRWESGKYVVEISTTDANGYEIKDIVYTEVHNSKDKTAADNALLEVATDKDSYLPNEEVVLTLKSASKLMTVTVDVEKNKKIVNSYVISLEDGKQTLRIPVKKEDEGGFQIHCSATIFNSFINKQLLIMVEYPPSDLTIETTTFRDKLKPNEEETWSFKVKGAKGEKVTAELLASMYDASLDEFRTHDWNFNPINKPVYYSYFNINAGRSFDITRFGDSFNPYKSVVYNPQRFDQLNWFGLYFSSYGRMYRKGIAYESNSMVERKMAVPVAEEVVMDEVEEESEEALAFSVEVENDKKTAVATLLNAKDPKSIGETTQKEAIVPRKNLQETAFFFPQLQTDSEGNVSFTFTTPEALTKWKLQLLAHTKELHSATKTLTTVTQKELMVLPNAPRFVREGDAVVISTKISNLSEKNLNGEAMLQLINPFTGNDINPALFPRLGEPSQSFSVNAKGNTQVSWLLYIPKNLQAIQYTITAKAGEYSDGEQNALPVLSNRMLVTETLPMWIRSNETKTFTLDKLAETKSATLSHHKLSLEITSNPAWYAVQALPYLMEYPYECSEQTFSRYYANALASHIANSNPRIQQVFNQWKSSDALLSNLEKNQELKSLILQETPWVRDAQSETAQKKRIALLFDLNRMQHEETRTLQKLQQMQSSSGGFPWFSGGRDNRFITQHIITGFGHLKKLNVFEKTDEDTQQLLRKAIQYLDAEFIKEYKDIRKYNKGVDLSKDHLSYSQLHYLYMRSFFEEIGLSEEAQKIRDYYLGQIDKYWLSRSLYSKGLMALIAHRNKRAKTANGILQSLKENSITSDELGMYWKANTRSWYWYQAPIETQALLIEAFSEISNDITSVDNLKIWLLKNKQTNRWSTTKATADAVYALLLQGSDWLSVTDMVEVTVGNQQISPEKLEDVKVEAGTGYFKTSWNGSEVQPEMAKVTLTKTGKGIAWGGLYWQYFEDLDKITTAETSLKLSKKLFKRTYDASGEVITEIDENTQLELGDLVRVRIELRNDRPMEFVHLKDMRAAGFEPVNVLSQYKWQDGLGYYESTKDASTNFFFDYLPKGVFVFEYDLRVNNKGDFSNGISTIQSMYAPEFSSHSEGIRVKVD